MGDPESVAPAGAATEDAAGAAGALRRLDPRFVDVERLNWFAALGVFLIVWAVLVPVSLFADGIPRWFDLTILAIAAVVIPLLLWLAIAWPKKVYRHSFYRISDEGIEIRRGVLVRRVINVPRSRVQHTDVTQGPIERRYGLATFHVYTAGTHFAHELVQGLPHEVALWCRDMLLPGRGADDGSPDAV